MRVPPADIFVWGLHPETTVNDIVNDLAASDIHIDAKDVEKKSKENAPRNSYRVSIPAPDLQKALDPGIWPMRVKVREYIYYPKKKVQHTSSSYPNTNPANMFPTFQPTMQAGVAHSQPAITVSNRYDPLQVSDDVENRP